ncbi:MAG TPA: AMP-binding protein, partial [Anaerolineaceae bacterium]|nr:AMP-binding protein [Anaerolineaceae bacterium]
MDRSGDHDFSDVRDTIVAMLRQKADDQPDKVIYSYLGEDENVAAQMTYAKLDQDARRIGARLQELHASGERALLIYPPGLAYISGFMGCLYAGVVAVPAYPPDPAKLDQILPKLLAIASDSQASLILTTSAVMGMAEKLLPMAPQLGQIRWLATDQLTEDSTSVWKPWDPEPSSLAYLQYTSGSTRQPKGVCLSHTNLITNTIAISRSFMVSHVDVVVLWLPMYHNMGLVGGVLQPFFSGCACYLMSPLAFLQQPARWLRAISKYRGTIAGCPNFGFDLCAQRIPAEQRARFDLRSWTVAFNGAEPVRADTLERFSRGFAECGFRREAFFPCYGLAESTLMVTTAKRGGGPVITLLDRKALNGNRVIPSDSADPSAVKLVSSGKTFSGQELRVVDPETLTECTAGRVGELWIRGPSVAQGYWNLPEESARTFNGFLANGQGPFLRSGDLAFIDQGECFITGRLKDLIILHGQNHYPQDLEAAVMSSQAGFLPNSGAAFSVDVAGEERLVVVQEVHPAAGEDLETVARVIREKIFDTDEIQTYAVVLVEDGQIPKTQSGKVSRQPCRQLYLAGQLKIIYEDRLDQPSPLRPAPQEQPGGAGEKVSLLHKALLALGPEGGRALVTSHLQGLLSDVLHIPPERIEVDKPLSGMGLDS